MSSWYFCSSVKAVFLLLQAILSQFQDGISTFKDVRRRYFCLSSKAFEGGIFVSVPRRCFCCSFRLYFCLLFHEVSKRYFCPSSKTLQCGFSVAVPFCYFHSFFVRMNLCDVIARLQLPIPIFILIKTKNEKFILLR